MGSATGTGAANRKTECFTRGHIICQSRENVTKLLTIFSDKERTQWRWVSCSELDTIWEKAQKHVDSGHRDKAN
jgi:coenzyme F420-reducing hydrogenase delta subunit